MKKLLVALNALLLLLCMVFAVACTDDTDDPKKNNTIASNSFIVESSNATINGLAETYELGDTVTFTVTLDSGYTIVSVKVNGVVVDEGNDGYSFVLTETTSIVVETEQMRYAPKVEGENHAMVEGLQASYLPGETATFTVNVDPGYKLDKVTLNDTELEAVEGVYTYVTGMNDVIVVVTSEYIANVSGTITVDGYTLTKEEAELLEVVVLDQDGDKIASSYGVYSEGTVSYSVDYRGGMATSGVRVVAHEASSDLSYPVTDTIAIDEAEDLTIAAEMYGPAKFISGLSSDGIGSGGSIQIYNFERGSFDGDFVIAAKFRMTGMDFSDSEWTSKTASLRLQLYANDESTVWFEVLNWMGTWTLRLYCNGSEDGAPYLSITDATGSLASEDGFVVVFSKTGDSISLYGVNNAGVKTQTATKTLNEDFDLSLVMVSRAGGVQDGLFSVSHMSIFNVADSSDVDDYIYKAETLAKNKVEFNEFDIQADNATITSTAAAYKFGDTVTFSVAPDRGYTIQTVKVNGDVVDTVNDGYSFVLTEIENSIEVETLPIPNFPTINEGDHATVELPQSSFTIGETATFTVKVEDGYVIESVTHNGAPLTAGEQGNYTYTVSENDTIVVTTSVKPITLTGTITNGSNELTASEAELLEIVVFDGENNKLNSVYATYSEGTVSYSITFRDVAEAKVVVVAHLEADSKEVYYPVSEVVSVNNAETIDISGMYATVKEIYAAKEYGAQLGLTTSGQPIYQNADKTSFDKDFVMAFNVKFANLTYEQVSSMSATAQAVIELWNSTAYGGSGFETVKIVVYVYGGQSELQLYFGSSKVGGVSLGEDYLKSLVSDGLVVVFTKDDATSTYSLYCMDGAGDKSNAVTGVKEGFVFRRINVYRQGGYTDGAMSLSNLTIIGGDTPEWITIAEYLATPTKTTESEVGTEEENTIE